MSGCCHVAAPVVIQVCCEPTRRRSTTFFNLSFLKRGNLSFLNLNKKGKSREHTIGAPSKRIQHPGWSSLRKTRVCARNANQAGPLLPSGPKVQGIAVVSESCVVLSPRKTRRPPAQVGLSSPPTARSSPCAAKPPSQTTNINMGAERRLPARSSPSDRGSSHNRGGGAQDGAASGFPKRWCRDLQASARGPPQQPPRKGGVSSGVTPRLSAFLH